MGRIAGTLGLAPVAAVEGPVAEEPAAAREGPAEGEEGSWRTRGLKE